jgi:glycosyltransferase involved in cell wall biosynthesis
LTSKAAQAGKSLRVIFVVESGTDFRLVDGLAKRFELEVVARKIDGGVEVSQTPAHPVAITVGPASRLRFACSLMKYFVARKGCVDAVIVQGYGVAALAANLSARWLGIPSYMLVCSPVESYYKCRKKNSEPEKQYKWYESAMLLWFARCNAVCGQHYIVLSRHLGETVRQHGSRRPIHVVPVYGVDTDVFRSPSLSKSELKAARSLPSDGSLLFFSSRIAPEKDADSLLAALRLLVDRGRNVRILHRSGGFRTFVEHAKGFGVEKYVVATDAVHPVTELPLDYQACDLCVQASRQEGLGFSVLEALACATPVVAAHVGGLKETIIHGETGWSYSPGDAVDLAACIEDALDHPEEAQRRARLGQRLVLRNFETRFAFDKLAGVMIHHASGKGATPNLKERFL